MASSRTRTKLVVTSPLTLENPPFCFDSLLLIRWTSWRKSAKRIEGRKLFSWSDSMLFWNYLLVAWANRWKQANQGTCAVFSFDMSQRCSVLLIRSCLTKVKGYPYTSATIELRLPSICQRTPGFVQDMCKPRIGFPSEKEKGDTFALKLSYKAMSANSGMSLLPYLLKSTFFVRKSCLIAA